MIQDPVIFPARIYALVFSSCLLLPNLHRLFREHSFSMSHRQAAPKVQLALATCFTTVATACLIHAERIRSKTTRAVPEQLDSIAQKHLGLKISGLQTISIKSLELVLWFAALCLAMRSSNAWCPVAAAALGSEPADPVPTGEDENLGGELTRKTTASTTSGEQLEREESNAQTHIVPASRMTTASDSDEVKDQPEKVASKEFEAKAEDEPIKVEPSSQETA